MTIKPATIIDTSAASAALFQEIRGEKQLAIDTESNSLHAYRERVCLIQLSTRSMDFIIDPLRLDLHRELPWFGEMLADPAVEKVFHAGEYDLMCLKRDYGYTFNNIFDTMIGSRILGVDQVGLDKLLTEHFGITLNKQYQLYNWARRPLKSEVLHYAQMDTHYLIPLRDEIYSQLVVESRWEEARELFADSTLVEWSKEEFDPEHFWKIKGAFHLGDQEAAILRELFIFRENEAIRRDLPVFKIIGDSVLTDIALEKPASLAALREIKGIGKRSSAKFGEGILNAINRGLTAPAPEKPDRPHRPDDEILARYEALYDWRKKKARERGVSSEVIASKEALWEIARRDPQIILEMEAITTLGPWRTKTYAQDILTVLQQHRSG